MTIAVIQTGGKQYKVSPGDSITVEKLEPKEGEVVFGEVLLIDDGTTVILGQPFIKGAKVTAEIVAQGRQPKIVVIKFKPKTGHRRKYGHRQPFTTVKIKAIAGS